MVHVSHSGFNLILGLVVSYLSQFCQVWLRIQKAHIHLEQCSIPIGSGLQMQLQGERPEAYHLVRMATKEQFSSHAADPRNCSLPTAFVFRMGSIGLICSEGLGLGIPPGGPGDCLQETILIWSDDSSHEAQGLSHSDNFCNLSWQPKKCHAEYDITLNAK